MHSISAAHPSEAEVLTRIAFAAKRHWGYPECWIGQWAPLLTVTPASIAADEIFTVRRGGRILGFAVLKVEGGVLLFDGLWVLPDEIGRGIGAALFDEARRRAMAHGFDHFEVESDPNAAGFYERMGAVRIGTHATEIAGRVRELPVFRCCASGV
ncbi:GNAT family N-acetyltransferase [Luteolibacter luteus]|uniref:GNAT family N-acetyltransferase n=1 Tax=Luteolibacter luteus TaxID=2728835 RepID=A0A858RF32_9BACT|nr:GNAT family N-acetyltransferase [Luteolibacter luteus]QJE95039.1 GNAT family N-acetyltransferase [Luteolibacter luteus]